MVEELKREDLLTVTEAAYLCHTSVATIRRWAAAGLLERIRYGHRTVLYRREDVLALARNAGTQTPGPDEEGPEDRDEQNNGTDGAAGENSADGADVLDGDETGTDSEGTGGHDGPESVHDPL